MAISAPGIGSSLDVNGIVEKLMSVERRPLDRLEKQQSSYQAELSAYGTLKGALSAFQTSVQGLSDQARFLVHTATVSDSAVLSATAGTSATPGSYSVEVRQLAQQQKLASAGLASTAETVGSGSLTIQFGTYDPTTNSFQSNPAKAAQTINVSATSSTLAGVRDAINAANVGIAATILNDGSANGNRLVLTSKDSGAANSIKITVSDDDGNNSDASGLSQLAFDPAAASGAGKNLTELQAGRNAVVVVDGITVTKPSNLITDAIQGVTLNLTKANVGSTAGLTVATDTAAIKQNIAGFVEAFNTLNKTIRDLTSYDPVTKRAGALQGESSARSALSQIRRILTESVGGSADLSSLSQIGVSFQRDGTLAVDSNKLEAAITENLQGVASLFAAAGSAAPSEPGAGGYASMLDQLVTGFLEQGGLVSSRTDGINSTIRRIGERQEALQRRLDEIEKRYRAQFTTLDANISRLQQTSSFLSQQLAVLTKKDD